ncbi:MAG: transporter substrate-binding domain-containing protein [Clostridia bacterium]|nr:transporter substrate-binding domain-containing protein [Clostridia bacterium]
MKKLLMLVLVVVLGVSVCAGLVACNEKGDLAKVEKAGKIVVGVTDYPPMDYKNAAGEWVGFDAELAQMFAAYLGVECEIVEITWSQKVAEINAGQIDLIWNGMTASDELGQEIDFSVSYAQNAQVAVVKSDSAIATKDQIKASSIAVENISAGDTVAREVIGAANVTGLTAQVDALNEVKAGTSQVAIVDLTLAGNVVGKGDYANLKIVEGISYGDEIFSVGLRKGSDLKTKLDEFLKEKYADGTMTRLVEKYGNVYLNEDALK